MVEASYPAPSRAFICMRAGICRRLAGASTPNSSELLYRFDVNGIARGIKCVFRSLVMSNKSLTS